MATIANFLGVDPASARKAATAESVRPESFAYNKQAFDLSLKAAEGAGPDRSKHGGKPRPMLNSTRALLLEFFEAHWDARFPDALSSQREPCASK